MDVRDIIDRMKRNPADVRFSDVCKVCEHYFGKHRQGSTSHRVYKPPWPGDPRVNIQSKKGKTPDYQVRQILKALAKLESEDYLEAVMVLEKDLYTYRVTWSQHDTEYVGLCAEFPSLSWLAATHEAALKGIRKVVADVVDDMRGNGESVPEPLASKSYSGNFVVRIPPEMHRDLVIEAAESNVSLNRLASFKLAK